MISKMQKIFYLFLIIIPCYSQSQCDVFFSDLYQTLKQNSTNFKPMQQNFINYSGKSTGDLGTYSSCSSISSMTYYVMEVSTASINSFTGICSPNYCSNNEMQTYFIPQDYFSSWGNSTVNGYVETNSYKASVNFWLYFVFVLMGVILVLNIFNTLIIRIMKKNDKKVEALLEVTDESMEPPKKANMTNFRKFLSSFDLISNIKEFFDYETRKGHDENLEVLAFWRCVSFMWVVAGHTAYTDFEYSQEGDFLSFLVSEQTALLYGGVYAVDIFLFIGGFVAAWTLVSKLKRVKRSFKTFSLIYFHRWLRIWPTYMVALLLFWQIMPLVASGPLSYEYIIQQQYCTQYSWQNVIFVDNWMNDDVISECFGWGWYLACDMQIFLFVPWIVWDYIDNPGRIKTLLWLLVILGSALYTFLEFELVASAYFIPVTRMPAYFLGLIFGLEYVEAQKNPESPQGGLYIKMKNAFKSDGAYFWLYIIASLFLVNLVALSYISLLATELSPPLRPLYILTLMLLLVACFENKLPKVKEFFRAPVFKILSKLTFSAYLLQLGLIFLYYYSQDTLGVFSGWQLLGNILLMITVSFFCAFWLHIFVEVPVIQIEKNFLRG